MPRWSRCRDYVEGWCFLSMSKVISLIPTEQVYEEDANNQVWGGLIAKREFVSLPILNMCE